MNLQGWRALGAAFAAGALAALAMPPLYWLPLAIVGVVAFVRLWDTSADPRQALWRGWSWGIGHFAVGSYWIVEAFYVPPADYGPLGVPIVTGLAVVLGFFPALAAASARWLVLRRPQLDGRYRKLVLLAVCWTVAEWLRGHVFTGYPWNPLAHVWAFALPLVQGASLFGVYGLGTFTFLVLAAPMAGWRASAAALGLVGLAGLGGQAVLASGDAGPASGPVVRIVQPNVPQKEKWQPSDVREHVERLIEMSHRDGFDKLAAVIWPETAVPFVVLANSSALPVLAAAAPRSGYLLTGAARSITKLEDGVWNSLLAIDPTGTVRAHYDKVHLVPLGEYIPFHHELAPVAGAIGRGSFEVGEGLKTIDLPGLPPFSPTICYEAIFPGAVAAAGQRPSWLLNVTNDAWFGLSSGPYQHFTSARMRAVEEGLPLIRAANTGVSAVIDGYGRVLASLDMERQGIIDHVLPPARSPTPYSRWGDWTLLAVLLVLAASIMVGSQRVARRL